MGLTALKSVRLEDAGLIDLFTKNRKHWLAMAEHALEYTEQFVEDTGEEVRPDDLIPILVPALELDSKLRDFLDKGKLPQQYWFTYFGELIIDEVWDELNEEEDDGDGEKEE